MQIILLSIITGGFLLIYGIIRFNAGLQNKKKCYWLLLGYTRIGKSLKGQVLQVCKYC